MIGEGKAYRVTTAEGELVSIECPDSRKLTDGYHTMAELTP